MRSPARAAAQHHRAARHRAEGRDRDGEEPGRAVGVAAKERAAVLPRIGAEARGEALEPALAHPAERDRQEKAERPRALAGEIGEIDAQRLARHRLGRIVGKEMHACDHRIGLENEVMAGRYGENRGVIDEGERTRMGRERPEMPRDQAVFARSPCRSASRHRRSGRVATRIRGSGKPRQPAGGANSPARKRRASVSSTALTMPVSSRSTKALATPTYSETTTRAGTSWRFSSS